jgi:phosphoribosylanthranilate isomerase
MTGFKRIQLNLKFGDVEGKYDPAQLLAHVKDNPQWIFIIQYGHDKKSLLPLLEHIPNHAVLFDESAGRGISPESWDKPLPGHVCGYAGGINPSNVQAHIDMIAKVAPGYTTWIDMETGVRTDDAFDLAKVRRVLEIARPYTR